MRDRLLYIALAGMYVIVMTYAFAYNMQHWGM